MLQAPQSEAEKIEAWRMQRLILAGYPLLLALRLATSDVDLHQAIVLLERGCAPETAARILL